MTARRIAFSLMLVLLFSWFCGQTTYGSAAEPEPSGLSFDIKWFDNLSEQHIQDEAMKEEGWAAVQAGYERPQKPAGKNAFLVRFRLPELMNGSGILFDGLSGHRFKLVENHIVLYDYTAAGTYPYHRILVPLHAADSGVTLYLYGKTESGTLGIGKAPLIGAYDELSSRYTREDLPNMTLGITLLFVAIVMLICSIFLTRDQLSNWLSLSIVVMSIGILIVLRCPFPYLFFGDYAALYGILTDAAIYVCLPVSAYFFEQLLESAWRPLVRYWRILLTLCCAVGFAVTLLNEWTDGRLFRLYTFLSDSVLDGLVLISIVAMIAHCLRSAWEGNKEAIIICIGFGIALAIAIVEIGWLFRPVGPIKFYLWEWPLTGFVFHLIVLLSKRYVKEHTQAASYIREMELYRKQLLESKQMEAASQLAASVAHEVRNPLSVTRGFLQLLRHRTASEAEPLREALQELDHAHDIITNYLKYAKPEANDIKMLDAKELLRETVMILNPLLLAQGVTIDYRPEGELPIRGISSQLKQALITILKQRVHALAGQGIIELQAYEEEEQAVIRMTDDAKPFITTSFIMPEVPLANQITDAGLIFAVRSIEAMNGKLVVRKRKGGSELIIRLPVAQASPAETESELTVQ